MYYRKAYGLLDLGGDIGGLSTVILTILQLILFPI